MKKQFFAAAMILALGAGFTACSNDDLGRQEGKEVARNADTYMTVSFTLPKANTTRATTAADGQDKPNPDFNHIGTWQGNDKISKVAIYVFGGHTAASTLEALQVVNNPTVSTVGGKVLVRPQNAFKVSAGQKTVFVVVNPTTETDAHLNATTGTTTLGAFTAQYTTTALALTAATGATVAEKVAYKDGTDDVITMTGSSAEDNIVAGVSASDAVGGVKNNVSLSVQRVVAGVHVSTKAPSYSFKGNNPEDNQLTTDFVTVSDLSYVVAQGEKSFYLLQQLNANTEGAAYTTPSYTYVPNNDYNTQAVRYYDYSGLQSNELGRKTDGLALQMLAAHELTNLTPTLNKSVFLLPVVHKFDAGDRTVSGYRKGNTPYVMVRGYLTPKKYVKTDGTIDLGTNLGEAADLYYGETSGFFYADASAALDATKHGVVGQKVRKFTKRVVLYWAWLNPDTNNINSPVIRNNIYNIHITGINNLGGNWNPLVPNDPDNPNNPVNPNPKPGDNPNEPDTPPVDPNDPLTLDKTWMSTNVTVLPWQVHSREIELSL